MVVWLTVLRSLLLYCYVYLLLFVGGRVVAETYQLVMTDIMP